MSLYLMQAASSVDGEVYTWTAADADFDGTGYPGDGDPTDVVVAMCPNPGFAALEEAESASAAVVVVADDLEELDSDLIRLTPLDANHIHAWEMTETSGASFVDTGSSAQKVDMAIANTANVTLGTPGLLGPCPVLGLTTTPSSAAAWASALVSAFNDLPATNMTFEAWVYQAAVSGSSQCDIVSCDFTNATNFQFFVGSTTNDNYGVIFRTANSFGNGSVGTLAGFAQATRAVGRWVHTAVTYDGAFFRMYIDGELLKKEAATGAIDWTYTNGPAPAIAIGATMNGSNPFYGRLARVRLSNVVRSQAYLRAVYQKAMRF